MNAAPARARFDPATLEIVWSRLHGVADEMWETIRRTSFSMIVSAILDFGCAILDAEGGQLVHPARSMPVFNLALPRITRDLLRRFEGRIYPGDVFIGNDPWLCCGHLPDVAIITPVFDERGLVGFCANIAHQADFGGAHGANRVREVYEEGIFLPVMKLYERGARNETLFEILRANVRTPQLVLGDLEAQVASNEVGARRLRELLAEYEREYGLDNPSELVAELQGRSERAMREIISALPDGIYRAEGWADAKGNPTKIAVAVTIAGDEILVDYAGTDDQLEAGGVNCTLAYTIGDTHYTLKAILAPEIPHNEGSTRPITVTAPKGSILNCTFPASVNARLWTGLHIYPVLNAALSQAIPDRAQAANGLYTFPRVVGAYPSGKGFNASIMVGGGQGGSTRRDGMGGYLFPIACSSISIELFENASPAMILEKEWVPDSAGAGQHRGGPAARISVRRLPGFPLPVRMFYTPIRGVVRAAGMLGGKDGTLDQPLWNGEPVPVESDMRRDGWTMFRSDQDELTFHAPSGAGFGDPRERDPDAVAQDIRRGLLTPEAAARDYPRPVAVHPILTAAATLVLSGADVKRLATAADLMASADSAFRELSAGDARVPARLKLDLGAGKRAIVMLGHLSRSRTLATKFVTVFADNAARGLPRILGVVVLNDPDTGGPLAIIDAASVTGLRTAAGSAVATRALARSGWSMLAVIGTGVQARAHLELFAQAFPLREVRVCGRRVEAAQELARDAASWTTASVHAAADVESAVRGAQVVVTATTAVAPLVKSEWLGAGCHVCAVGAASPTIREIGSDVIERAAVVAVDTREGALSEAGEAVLAIAERRLSADRLAEMGEILLGRRRGRQKEDELTLYKSVGTAALDAAAASALYLRAREQGVGTEVFLMAGE